MIPDDQTPGLDSADSPAEPDSNFKPYIGIGLIALVVRVIYHQLQIGGPYFDAPFLDELYYFQWASEIADGAWMGDRAFFRAPLYGYFLGILFKLFGPDFYILLFLQHLGGIAGAILTGKAAERYFGEPRVGYVAAILAALYAPGLFFEGQFLDIWLQTLCIPILLIAGLRACERGTLLSWFLFGLLGGVAAIIRPTALPFIALAGLASPWLIHRTDEDWNLKKQSQRIIVRGVVTIVGLLIPILPVTYHNYLAEEAIIPIASYAGINFWIGNNSVADGHTSSTPERYLNFGRYEDSVELFAKRRAEEISGSNLNSAEIQSYWMDQGWQEVRSNPARVAKLTFKKVILFFNARELKNNKNIYVYAEYNIVLRMLLYIFQYGLILALAAAGWISAFKKMGRARFILMNLMLFSLIITVIPFFVNIRYRFPFAYALLPFSAYGLITLLDTLRPTFEPTRNLKAWIVFIAVAVFAHLPFYRSPEANPGEARAADLWSIGNAWKDKGELEQAELAYQEAVELAPFYSDAWNNLGEVQHRMDNPEAALASFSNAVTNAGVDGPARLRALNNIGVTLEGLGRLDEAVATYRSVVSAAPDHAMAWSNLGDALRKSGELSDAKTAYATAIGINRRLPLALLGLASIAQEQGNTDEQIRHMTELHQLVGDETFAHILEQNPNLR